MGILLVYDVTDESSFNSELFYCLFWMHGFAIATLIFYNDCLFWMHGFAIATLIFYNDCLFWMH